MARLARLGDCYSPTLTQTNFRFRSIFIAIHEPQYKALRFRLLACTPKAWEKLRNNRPLLEMLRSDIGEDGKGRIQLATEAALTCEFVVTMFSRDGNGSGYIGLHLLGKKEKECFDRIFDLLGKPTDQNLDIFENMTGQRLNIRNLTVPQRRMLLAWLKDQGLHFEDIGKVTILSSSHQQIRVKKMPDGTLNISISPQFNYPKEEDIGFYSRG